jgi:hypothetical protein
MPLTMLVTASVRLPSISSSLPLTIEITPTTVNPMPQQPMPDATEAVIHKIVTIAPRTAIILLSFHFQFHLP